MWDLSLQRGLFVVVRRLLPTCGVQVFLSLVVVRRLQGTWALACVGSVVGGRWALSLRHVSSVVVAQGLSCPAACGILVPPPGMEPVSPALEGGFFTTGPPGKFRYFIFLKAIVSSIFKVSFYSLFFLAL